MEFTRSFERVQISKAECLDNKSCNSENFSHNAIMRTHQYRDIICNTCECRHLSADDIYEIIKKESPKIWRATVYRNIEAMAEQWILRRFPWINGKTYYECNDNAHAHIVDGMSGIICDFPLENIRLEWLPPGYEVSEIRIEIRKKDETI